MHAYYSFATRYYTQEVHDALQSLWNITYFPGLPVSDSSNVTRDVILEAFADTGQEHMLEIEVDEFENRKDVELRTILKTHMIPFERMHYAYDGYTGERIVYYPDGTFHSELVDEDNEPVIPAFHFNQFFLGSSKVISTKLTADNFFKVIDDNTLKFKTRADYYIENDYIYIDPVQRTSIEDVLKELDEGLIGQEEALKRITEIKSAKGNDTDEQLSSNGE